MSEKDNKSEDSKSFYRTSVIVDKETHELLKKLAESKNESMANVIRDTIKKGLASEWIDENTELVANIVRQQMEAVIKPHVERLAKIGSKSGHMSATATFLNVQALQDLVPKEKRKNVIEMYENARKKSVEYMKTPTKDWESSVD